MSCAASSSQLFRSDRLKDTEMQAILELWDEETAPLINTYVSAPAALAVVAATIREHGRDAVENWILLRAARRRE
jgi:hypothetical protein